MKKCYIVYHYYKSQTDWRITSDMSIDAVYESKEDAETFCNEMNNGDYVDYYYEESPYYETSTRPKFEDFPLP